MSASIAADIRHHFRTAVKEGLQLSLAALPWPASPLRESNSTCDYLHVRSATYLRTRIALDCCSQGNTVTPIHSSPNIHA